MSLDALTERLLAAGYADVDASARAALVDRVDRAFHSVVGSAPAWRWLVPGRIEVFGKHTDYAGGRSLVTAVPRGFAVVASPRDDGVVRVVDAEDGSTVVVPSRGQARRARGWANYVGTVVQRLAVNFQEAALGVDVALQSDLPRAAGLSSSSALVVSVAMALIRRGRLDSTPQWAHAIGTRHDLAWYLGCVENGLDYPSLPGTAGVGTLGGSEDHTAILTCRARHASQNRYTPIRHLGDVRLPDGWTFVVASSGVGADKTGAAQERYNRLSRATRVLLALWNESSDRPQAESLAAVLASGPWAADALQRAVERSEDASFGRAELGRRLAHFIREDGRVPQAVDAVAAGDLRRLGELAAASQRDADELIGNQVEETRTLVRLALEGGAWAASSFGAGFGGSVWALAPSQDADRFALAWTAAYRARVPDARMQAFVAPPAPSLTEL